MNQATTKNRIESRLAATPFVPYPALKNAHAQTIIASMLSRSTPRLNQNSEPRYFDVAAGVRVLAHCSWQPDREARPTLLILHGMEGSADSHYMLGTAEKALGAGFNAIRLNMRNCGGTEHLTPTLYHAGLTEDLRVIINELIEQDGLDEIYIAGFSLGGNIVLKLAGEYGGKAPRELRRAGGRLPLASPAFVRRRDRIEIELYLSPQFSHEPQRTHEAKGEPVPWPV